jgi:hypothetical protein
MIDIRNRANMATAITRMFLGGQALSRDAFTDPPMRQGLHLNLVRQSPGDPSNRTLRSVLQVSAGAPDVG